MSKTNTRSLYAAFIAGALTVATSGVQAQEKEVVIGLSATAPALRRSSVPRSARPITTTLRS